MSYGIADPEKIYEDQLAQSTVCTWTQSAGGTAIINSVGLGISFSGSGGTQSLANNSAAGSEGHKGQVSRPPLRSQSESGLPTIDEVDSPDKIKVDVGDKRKVVVGDKTEVEVGDKTEVDVGNKTKHRNGGDKTNVDVGNVGVSAIVTGATKVDLGVASTNVTVEMELEEHIKKLKDEVAEFERLRKLRLEAAVLERLKKLREEAVESEVGTEASKQTQVAQAVMKMSPPPLLPPLDAENPSKRKTRSELAAAAKEAEEAKKKNKRSKKNRRG